MPAETVSSQGRPVSGTRENAKAALLASLPSLGSREIRRGLVVGFGASLAAFVLALSWERDQGQERLTRGAEVVEARHATEVGRRLTSVRAELEVNPQSLSELHLDPGSHPQLLDGA